MRRWVDSNLARLRAGRCRHCAAPCGDVLLCGDCAADLPWNQPACPGCAAPQDHDAPCRHCARRLPPFDAAWTAFRLEPPIQHAVHALKYHASFVDVRMLGELLASRLAARAQTLPQLLLPVPLHAQRLRRRGYNQALEVARVVSRTLRVPLGAAHRLRATADQIGMTAAQRRRNVRGAFAVPDDLSGLQVALLDDVMTTGATLGELARACRAAGAARVEAWAIARVA